MKMSPEAQRIAIAEADGWRVVKFGSRRGMWRYSGDDGTILLADNSLPPDYPNDLNWMRHAVEHCSDQTKHTYAVVLAMMFWPNGWASWLDTLAISQATAGQRAEAFLKAINKWEDSA